jgi:hypothetical protein
LPRRCASEDEGLEVVDEHLFQIILGVLVLESEELEDERIAYLVVGAEGVAGLCLCALGEHGSLVPGKAGTLTELGGDLAVELTH